MREVKKPAIISRGAKTLIRIKSAVSLLPAIQGRVAALLKGCRAAWRRDAAGAVPLLALGATGARAAKLSQSAVRRSGPCGGLLGDDLV